VVRAKIPLVEQAFVGRFTHHHAFLLATMLARIDEASADIAAVETRIEELIVPFGRAVERLDEITGVGRTAAHVMIAEIGVDMSRFPTAAHCSWARFAPGVKESAGKTKGRGATGHGNPYLARVLGEAASPRARPTPSSMNATGASNRRRGEKRDIVAVGRSILVIVWHLLSDPDARYRDLGSDFYDTRIGPDRKERQPRPATRSPRLQGHPRSRGLRTSTPVPNRHPRRWAPFARPRLIPDVGVRGVRGYGPGYASSFTPHRRCPPPGTGGVRSPTGRTSVHPDRARELLTTELAELDRRARFAAESRADAAEDPVLAEGALSQHPGDYGSDVANRMEDRMLVDTVAEQRRAIENALARLDDGSYGHCAVCGRDIDDERLEARPEVPTCREHADAPVGPEARR
jgi:RNA polymerase-binding transcription factor DksA